MNLKRRALLVAATIAVSLPGVALAQPAERAYGVGFLTIGSKSRAQRGIERVRRALERSGAIAGRGLRFEVRAAAENLANVKKFAGELGAARLDALLADGVDAAAALREATASTPIVAVVGLNPQHEDAAVRIIRGGGNVTGVTFSNIELAARRLELLRQVFPESRRIRFLTQKDAERWVEIETRDAAKLGFRIEPHMVEDLGEMERFFARRLRRDEAIYVATTARNALRLNSIVTLANQARARIVYPATEYAEAGGLMSCAADQGAALERAAGLLLRVLQGAKPAEIPVERSTEVFITVNRGAAKELGVTIPPEVLARADRVID